MASSESDILALLRDLDEVVDAATPVFPGRALLRRKRTNTILDLMSDGVTAGGVPERRDEAAAYLRAVLALDRLQALVSMDASAATLWGTWYVLVRRRVLSESVEELRTALTRLIEVRGDERWVTFSGY